MCYNCRRSRFRAFVITAQDDLFGHFGKANALLDAKCKFITRANSLKIRFCEFLHCENLSRAKHEAKAEILMQFEKM